MASFNGSSFAGALSPSPTLTSLTTTSGLVVGATLAVTGAATLSSTLLMSGIITVNNKMTMGSSGRMVLPVGTNLWAT